MNVYTLKRAAIVWLALVALGAVPRAAYSQQMNFSYYADIAASGDETTLYTVVNGSDNSTGCYHYDYESTGYVSGPTGYYSNGPFSGLSSYVDVPMGPATSMFPAAPQ